MPPLPGIDVEAGLSVARGDPRFYRKLLFRLLDSYGDFDTRFRSAQADPDPQAAMRLAMRSAGLQPQDISYINAHGTSTPLGDKAETKAVKQVFGDHARVLSISSTKSQLGHTLGASGGIELVVTMKTIQRPGLHPQPAARAGREDGHEQQLRVRRA